ncbi:MAG TPA: Uma2 family endonuclease [Pyrinomonadaceae bacterium]|nr:Uma2 family endonuclease [Pyrinomonadaceae bacterium]
MGTVSDSTSVTEILTDGILLHNISWSTYESLLRDHPDAAMPRFTYDRGELLINRNSALHEQLKCTFELVVALLTEVFEIECTSYGSTTFKRKDLQRGFEPDCCFYSKHESRMRGRKRINLPKDPPPELVIDINISSPSIRKLPVFAAFGIPEAWQFAGDELHIFVLHDQEYTESKNSLVLPQVTGEAISKFILESLEIGRLEWVKKLQAWARQKHLEDQ